MKNFWIFIIACYACDLFCHRLSAQADTSLLHQAYQAFSNSEKAEWTAFENNWNYFEYGNIQKKYKVSKLNCKNCGSFYADVYLEIDEKGNIVTAHFLKGRKCGLPCDDKIFAQLFEDSVKKQRFGYLKNKSFIARFGHILKC